MFTKTIPLPPILIKVGSKENLEKIINNGEIYFGSMSGYRNEDSVEYKHKLWIMLNNHESHFKNYNFFREDPLESVESIIYPSDLKDIYTCKYHQKHTHVFSAFGFGEKVSLDFEISEFMRQFGDYFIIINSRSFLEKIYPILIKENISKNSPEYGFVKYFDVIPGGNLNNLTHFHKKKYYEYQYEYRLLGSFPSISPEKKGSIINIGPNPDIFYHFNDNNQLFPISELFNMQIEIMGEDGFIKQVSNKNNN